MGSLRHTSAGTGCLGPALREEPSRHHVRTYCGRGSRARCPLQGARHHGPFLRPLTLPGILDAQERRNLCLTTHHSLGHLIPKVLLDGFMISPPADQHAEPSVGSGQKGASIYSPRIPGTQSCYRQEFFEARRGLETCSRSHDSSGMRDANPGLLVSEAALHNHCTILVSQTWGLGLGHQASQMGLDHSLTLQS